MKTQNFLQNISHQGTETQRGYTLLVNGAPFSVSLCLREKYLGKNVLSTLVIALLLFTVLSCNTSFENDPATWQEAKPLHEIYQDDFLMGNIIRNTGDFSNATRSGILKRHYTIVTAENDMKPNYIAPNSSGGEYRFTTADTIVNNARNAGMKVHGHTLIWHSQTPSWLSSGGKEVVLANMEKYVTDVVTHFKGKVISWDVVNEAFRDGLTSGSDWKNCLRLNNSNSTANDGSPWNRAIGPDYIEMAFLAARAADPDAKLYYNDYSLNNVQKAQAVYDMVREINLKYPNESGRPLIDGIGMQSHHNIATSVQSVETSIQLFASLGVEVSITELDILANNGGGVNDPRLGAEWNDSIAQKQAEQYAAMFRVFKDNARYISRVTFWGIDDGTSWRSENHATLLNGDYSLKPAFHAVMNPNRY